MRHCKSPQQVAVVGAGVIGASWAALFASNGLRTIVYDPQPAVEQAMWSNIDAAIATLQTLDPYQTKDLKTMVKTLVTFTTDQACAIRSADVIQENIPEIVSLKHQVLSSIESQMKDDALVLSSTSGITPSELQVAFKSNASQFLIGHPFNPPHLIPLVEVVGGKYTSEESINRTMTFYRSLGKKPVRLMKELPGHIANRMQAALFREIMYLLQNDVASVADIDAAIEFGPGLRWGVMGPSALLHLGGGPQGAKGYAEKFMKHLMSWYAPQDPVMNNELVSKWVEQTTASVKGRCIKELEQDRDSLLVGLINSKAEGSGMIP